MQMKITARSLESVTPASRPYDIRDLDLTGFGARVQPSGKITYFCDYRIRGRRNRISLSSSNVLPPQIAREEAKKILGEVAAGRDPKESLKRSNSITLQTFLTDHYGPWVLANRKSGADTKKMLESCFASFLRTRLNEITAWTVEKWKVERINADVQRATVNRNVTALKSALSSAVQWSLIKENPLKGLKALKVDSTNFIRYLESEERKRLMQALEAREARIRTERQSGNLWRLERGYKKMPTLETSTFADYLMPMVLISLNTGLRQGELFQLRWDSINLSNRFIKVESSTSKSGQCRYIPLNEIAHEAILKWQKSADQSSDLVFPSENGKPFNNVSKSWATILETARVLNFRWHDMRHDFASQLVMSGVDLNTVRELLGHSDIKMTLRYAHLSPQKKAEAVGKLLSIQNRIPIETEAI